MLLSIRECAALLADVGLTYDQSRLLLRAGLAGPGTRVGTSTAYDQGAALALAGRAEVASSDLMGVLAPAGLYVARLSRAAQFDVARPWRDLAAVLCGQPAMPEMTRALLAARIAGHDRLPWVATLLGFVVLGAEAIGVGADRESGTTRFALEPPGPWWTHVEHRRLRTGRGRPGLLLLPPWCAEPRS